MSPVVRPTRHSIICEAAPNKKADLAAKRARQAKKRCVHNKARKSENLQVDELNLAQIGPKFEHHEMFPARTNTEFVQVFYRSHLKMRVWERGAGG
ncbi:hypothetical protein LOK49_LG10G01564 [Camellia lanceoleosa]|uniref:Uncharacterized protein n=1 Tax=Camellia lanceoleosa TaxID=1840588 RepID=A0ACC0G541_9ERIC|nr:hypothetical protein LOK49_LG10G01564 [Camellia lanceoleosa]